MLKWRVLSAVVGIPLAIAVVVGGGVYLLIPLLALAVLAAHEMITKCREKSILIPGTIVYPVVVLLPVMAYGWTEPPLVAGWGEAANLSSAELALSLLAAMLYLVVGALLVGLIRFHRDQTVPIVRDVGATVLTGVYVAVPWTFVLMLRTYPFADAVGPGPLRLEVGARLLLFVFLVTWATDIAAYFVGRSLGKRKLTPASPNKTVEGALGGLIGAVVVGLAAGLLLGLPAALAAIASPLLGLMGQLGDLAKSIMKRDLGTKDFGSLIPGHGGSLDRFDSLMVNAPIAFFCALAFMTG
jgi:phosphatidate cytidylyltransferase